MKNSIDDMDALQKTTRANQLRQDGDVRGAIRLHLVALRERPDVDIIYLNLGACFENRGWLRWAELAYRRALQLQPARHEAAVNLSLLLLKTRHYEEGFSHFMRRWHCAGWPQKRSDGPLPYWRGEPAVANASLVLIPDQGYGDCIQAARFCRWLKRATSFRIVLLAQAPLQRLFAQSELADQVMSSGQVPVSGAKQVSMWDIPSLLGWGREELFPQPYLKADQKDSQLWRERLRPIPGPRVGIVWRGNPNMQEDRWRSLNPSTLKPLLAEQSVRFVSLQRDATDEELTGLADLGLQYHAGRLFSDFADTAACLENLDLLITVDTAIAHVAGALGIPVWLLLYGLGDWRWGHSETHSDWYPSIRIFRQRRLGDWTDVVTNVVTALQAREFAANKFFPASAQLNSMHNCLGLERRPKC